MSRENMVSERETYECCRTLSASDAAEMPEAVAARGTAAIEERPNENLRPTPSNLLLGKDGAPHPRFGSTQLSVPYAGRAP